MGSPDCMVRVNGQHPSLKTPPGVLPWTCWSEGKWRDTPAGKATLTRGLLLGRSEVLRSLRHYLPVQSRGHHAWRRGVERGNARQFSLKWQERAIINQMNTRTAAKAVLGKLLWCDAQDIPVQHIQRRDRVCPFAGKPPSAPQCCPAWVCAAFSALVALFSSHPRFLKYKTCTNHCSKHAAKTKQSLSLVWQNVHHYYWQDAINTCSLRLQICLVISINPHT